MPRAAEQPRGDVSFVVRASDSHVLRRHAGESLAASELLDTRAECRWLVRRSDGLFVRPFTGGKVGAEEHVVSVYDHPHPRTDRYAPNQPTGVRQALPSEISQGDAEAIAQLRRDTPADQHRIIRALLLASLRAALKREPQAPEVGAALNRFWRDMVVR